MRWTNPGGIVSSVFVIRERRRFNQQVTYIPKQNGVMIFYESVVRSLTLFLDLNVSVTNASFINYFIVSAT